MPGRTAVSDWESDRHYAESDPDGPEAADGGPPPSAAHAVRSVHRAYAVAQCPHRTGPDRSALQLERETTGTRAAPAGALRQAGQAAPGRGENLSGNVIGDRGHHPVACELLHEKIQAPGIHRLLERSRRRRADQQFTT